jgi:ankyrin repeat protein
MVFKILTKGANANALDHTGRTALHEVLQRTHRDREEDVIKTLEYLGKFGADPDISANLQSPRLLAQTHPFAQVQKMFARVQKKSVRIHTRRGSAHIHDKIKTDSPK